MAGARLAPHRGGGGEEGCGQAGQLVVGQGTGTHNLRDGQLGDMGVAQAGMQGWAFCWKATLEAAALWWIEMPAAHRDLQTCLWFYDCPKRVGGEVGQQVKAQQACSMAVHLHSWQVVVQPGGQYVVVCRVSGISPSHKHRSTCNINRQEMVVVANTRAAKSLEPFHMASISAHLALQGQPAAAGSAGHCAR